MQKSSDCIAIFDLDFTLLNGDTEAMWSHFLFEQGLVDEAFLQGIRDYYQDYDQGRLDIHEYEAFFLRPLTLLAPSEQLRLRAEFLKEYRGSLRPGMLHRLRRHRSEGHTLLLVTAANDFLARPVAGLLGFENLISTMIKKNGDVYTTELEGIPAFREGKVQRLQQWLSETGRTLEVSWGYSDSHNDIPILSLVKHPVAVSPDPQLEQFARQHGWKILAG